jgi:hypothetical protein
MHDPHLLAVKENQPDLHEAACTAFASPGRAGRDRA